MSVAEDTGAETARYEQAARQYREMDLLRFTTAGSVDDGKSTLIGRLLYDTKSIFEDQLEAIEGASRRRGEEGINLALLTDGLRAEREQNITIDVAYRYFATPRRKFIIADTPGHVQYTRNMVTGASARPSWPSCWWTRARACSPRAGGTASSRRCCASRTSWWRSTRWTWWTTAQEVYDAIVADYTDFAEKLGIQDLTFIPMSALEGDNVVDRRASGCRGTRAPRCCTTWRA